MNVEIFLPVIIVVILRIKTVEKLSQKSVAVQLPPNYRAFMPGVPKNRTSAYIENQDEMPKNAAPPYSLPDIIKAVFK